MISGRPFKFRQYQPEGVCSTINQFMYRLAGFILCSKVIASHLEWLDNLESRQPLIINTLKMEAYGIHYFEKFETKCKVLWITNYWGIIDEGGPNEESSGKSVEDFFFRLLQIPTINKLDDLGDYIDGYFTEQLEIEERRFNVIQAFDHHLLPSTIKYLLGNGFLEDHRRKIPELMSLFFIDGIHPIDRFSSEFIRVPGRPYLPWSLYLECHVGPLGSFQIPQNELIDLVEGLYKVHYDKSESFIYSAIKCLELLQTGHDNELLLGAYKLAGLNFMEIMDLHFMTDVGCRKKFLSSGIFFNGSPFKFQNMSLDNNFCQLIKNVKGLSKDMLIVFITVKETRSFAPKLASQLRDVLIIFIAVWKRLIFDYFSYNDHDNMGQLIYEHILENSKSIEKISRFTTDDLIDSWVWGCPSPLIYRQQPSDPIRSWAKKFFRHLRCAISTVEYEFQMCYMRWILKTMPEDQKWATLERYLNLPENSTKVGVTEKFLEKFIRSPLTSYILMTLFSRGFVTFDVDWMFKNTIIFFWNLGDLESSYNLMINEIDERLLPLDQMFVTAQIASDIKDQILSETFIGSPTAIDEEPYTFEGLIGCILEETMEGTGITSQAIQQWIAKKCND